MNEHDLRNAYDHKPRSEDEMSFSAFAVISSIFLCLIIGVVSYFLRR